MRTLETSPAVSHQRGRSLRRGRRLEASSPGGGGVALNDASVGPEQPTLTPRTAPSEARCLLRQGLFLPSPESPATPCTKGACAAPSTQTSILGFPPKPRSGAGPGSKAANQARPAQLTSASWTGRGGVELAWKLGRLTPRGREEVGELGEEGRRKKAGGDGK